MIPATQKTPAAVINSDDLADGSAEDIANCVSVDGGITTKENVAHFAGGAGFALMMTVEKTLELGFTPKMKWATGADEGCLPNAMGIATAYSNLKSMRQAGLSASDVAVFERNEAFAAQNLAVIKEMETQLGKKINRDK